jgi:hypothetical protein
MEKKRIVGCRWLTPVILATQDDLTLKPSLGKYFMRPYLKQNKTNLITKKGLAEWLNDIVPT